MMTQHSPLVGITVYNSDDEKYYYPADYIHSIRYAGGVPVLLPPNEPDINKLIHSLDGIVLTGGGDINPNLYDGEHHQQLYWVNDLQDKTEIQIAKIALECQKPLLATCRGLQLINILFGGTLHLHLPDVYGEQVSHRSKIDTSVNHQVKLKPDSNLAAMLACTEFPVKSWHHQSIDTLAKGFEIVGESEDGVIEAIESKQYPNLIAVQWHPEINNSDSPVQQILFKRWLQTCRPER